MKNILIYYFLLINVFIASPISIEHSNDIVDTFIKKHNMTELYSKSSLETISNNGDDLFYILDGLYNIYLYR